MTLTVFYTPDEDGDPHGLLEPRRFGLTVEQAASYCREYLVMWSPTYELFGKGFKTPTPRVRFFYQGREIINPWAFYKPIPPTPETRRVRSQLRQPDVPEAPVVRGPDEADEALLQLFDG